MADVPVIDLDPYLLAVQATLMALQAAGLIPDLNPLDYIISAFDGKPKLEDTEIAALRLQASPWWPLRALGNNLQIWVKNGVPLSTGIAADRQELSQWIQGTIDSIEPIVFNRFDPYSLDHAIWLAMTSQFGDQAIRNLNDEIANQHALGPLPDLPTTPTQPPGPLPVPSGSGVHLSRDGDELADYGDTLIYQNTLLYNLITFLAGQFGGKDTADCCTKVVTAIGAITSGLSAIADAVSSSGNAGNLITALTTIGDAISSIAPMVEALRVCVCALETGTTIDLQPLVDAVNVVASKLDGLTQSIGQVGDQLGGLTSDSDPDGDAFVNYLVSVGALPDAIGSILLGQG